MSTSAPQRATSATPRDQEGLGRSWVILNPRSARGRGPRDRQRLEERLRAALNDPTLAWTRGPMDAAALAREACRSGATQLLVSGGDGTVSEVVNGLMEEPVPPPVGLLPHGTGGDFCRSLRLPSSLDAQLAVIAAGRRRAIDIGRLHFVDDRGTGATRHFVNTASAGMSGEVCAAVNRMRWAKRLGGTVAFNVASLRALATYANPKVALRIDGGPTEELVANTIAVCNGRYFGGGMMIAPEADLADGRFHVVTLGDLRWFDTVRAMPRLYRGTHLSHPKASCRTARTVEIGPLDERPLRLEVDGEAPGRGPARFEILPGALEVFVPEPSP